MRVLDARSRRCGPTDRTRTIPIADFHKLPGDTPHVETALAPGELITGGDAAEAVRRHAHLSQGPRPGLLRLRARLGRGGRSRRTAAAASRWAASRTKPWRVEAAEADHAAVASKAGGGWLARRCQTDPRQPASRCPSSSARSERCSLKRGPDSMKFDSPTATTNPIDQLKVDRQTDRPHRRASYKVSGHGRAYAYEQHDVVANASLWRMSSAPASPRVGSRRWTSRPRRPRRACSPIVTAENAGKLTKGNMNTAKLLGGPEVEHYHQADRGGRGRRPSSRLAPAPKLVRDRPTTSAQGSPTIWRPRSKDKLR